MASFSFVASVLVAVALAAPSTAPQPAAQQVAEQIFAFDLLVAAAQQAPVADPRAAHRLAENGMLVAPRPHGLTPAQAEQFWQAASRTSPSVQAAARKLFFETDVVTTEAHALMLSMVGAAPDFAVQPPLAGLEARQETYARRAAELSQLMAACFAQAGGPALWRALSPALAHAQPSGAELMNYDQRLESTFSGQTSALPATSVLVAPLMAQDTGATLMLSDRTAVLLLGPSASVAERDTLALHEMLHPRIAALVREHPALAAAIAGSACLRDAYQAHEPNVQVSQVYDGWADYVAESWVRGLSHRLGHTPQERFGFPLAPALAALCRGQRVTTDVLARRAIDLLQSAKGRLCGHRR